MRQPGYPPARIRADLGPRFAAARYADLVGLAETLTAQPARKCGTRYRMVCPFHAGDRDPSLVIYPPGKGWHCFGCGKGGDAVTFCREFFRTSVVEALLLVEQLADTYPEAWGAAS
jgi:DNA primase